MPSKKFALALLLIALVGAAGAATIAGTPLTQNDDGVVLNQPDGPQATMTGDVTLYNDSGGVSGSQIQLNTSEGSVALYSTDNTEVNISAFDIQGSWTNTTNVNATAADLTINPGDKSNFTVAGSVDRLDFRDAVVDDGAIDVYLDGSGAVTIEPSGLPADTTIYAIDSATGRLADANTTDSAGQAAFDLNLETGRNAVPLTNGVLKQDWSTEDRAIRFVTVSPETSAPAVLDANSGPNITVTGSTSVSLTDPFPFSNTVNLSTTAGGAEFVSNGASNATVASADIEGSYTNLTSVDASSNAMQVNPGDKAQLAIDGGTTSIDWRDYTADDGTVDIVADGSGTSELSLTGLPSGDVYAVDAEGLVDVNDSATFVVDHSAGTRSVSYANGKVGGYDFTDSRRGLELRTTGPLPAGDYYEAADGMNVTLSDDAQTPAYDPFPFTNTVNLSTTAAQAEFVANGAASATIAPGDLEGTFTNISSVDASTNAIQVNPSDKSELTIDGAATDVKFSDYQLDDGATDTIVTGPDGTSTDLSYFDLQSDITTTAVNASFGSALAVEQTSSTGQVTYTIKHSSQTIELQSGDQSKAPVLANADPVGPQNEIPGNLTVDVSDADFPDDEVEVAIDYDGSEIKRTNITSNSTVAADLSSTPLGGSHDWTATATDRFGNTTSETYTFSVPDELNIYNESAPTERLNNTTADIEFYFDRDDTADLIVTRNTSDGSLDMTGLPVDEPFVVVAQSDGYFNRRIYVPSLFETQSIYLLDENSTAVQPTFRLVDYTGAFPRDTTVVEAQRSLNGTWETVEGDYFGASNAMTAQLSYNERHRIIITNTATGESRDLGVYTPTATSSVELEVHEDDSIISEEFAPVVQVDPLVGSLPARAGLDVTADVEPDGGPLQEYTVSARLSNGTELYNRTYTSGEGGVHNFTVDASGAEGQSVVVWVNWTTEDGETGSVDTVYDIREYFDNEYSILSVMAGADMGGETPNTLSVLVVLVLSMFATGFAATEMKSGPAGLVGLSVITGGALLGWIPFPWVVAGGVTWLVLSGVTNRI